MTVTMILHSAHTIPRAGRRTKFRQLERKGVMRARNSRLLVKTMDRA